MNFHAASFKEASERAGMTSDVKPAKAEVRPTSGVPRRLVYGKFARVDFIVIRFADDFQIFVLKRLCTVIINAAALILSPLLRGSDVVFAAVRSFQRGNG